MSGHPRRIRGSLIVGADEWKVWAKRLSRYPNQDGLVEYDLYHEDGRAELPVTATDFHRGNGEIRLDQVPARSRMKFRWRMEEWE